MCGIVGMISTRSIGFPYGTSGLFNQMLVCDSVRGADSTGVFGVTDVGNVDYLKVGANPFELMLSNEYKDFVESIWKEYHFVIGHNRKATIGTVKDETAHPFQEGNIVLVHNGTLTNHKGLTTQEVEVDSHAITHAIVEKGYKQAISELDGAYTLVWYDAGDKKLRLVRNDKRPLMLAKTKDFFLLSSEGGLLEWLTSRDNTHITNMEAITPDTIYEFDLNKPGNFTTEKLPEKPKPLPAVYNFPKEVKEITAKKPSGTAVWNTSKFEVNDPITCRVISVDDVSHAIKEKHNKVLRCVWVVDPSISVRVYITEQEEQELSCYLDSELISCQVTRVFGYNNNLTCIIGHSPVEYIPDYEITGMEVLPDEWNMLPTHKCAKCSTIVSWDDINESRFKYKSPTSYRIVCKNCCSQHRGHKCC